MDSLLRLSLSIISPCYLQSANRRAREPVRIAPQACPVCPGSRTMPRSAWQPLPVCVQSRTGWQEGEQVCMRATESTSVVHAPRPRSRLKTRTIARLESGGAGAHLAARFFPIIHRTPPYFFRLKRPYLAGTRRTSPDAVRSLEVRVFTPYGSRFSLRQVLGHFHLVLFSFCLT